MNFIDSQMCLKKKKKQRVWLKIYMFGYGNDGSNPLQNSNVIKSQFTANETIRFIRIRIIMVKRMIARCQDSRFILSRGLFLPPWRLQPTPRPFFDRSRFPEKRVFYTRSAFSWFTAANTARNVTQSAIFLYLSLCFLRLLFRVVFLFRISFRLDDMALEWENNIFFRIIRNFIRIIRLLLKFF